MKKFEKTILFIIAIITSVIVMIIVVLKHNNSKKKDDLNANEITYNEQLNSENKIRKIDSNQDYFDVKNCLNSYKNISNNWNNATKMNDKQKLESAKQELTSILPRAVIESIGEDNYDKVVLEDGYIRMDSVYKSVQTISEQEYIEDTNICAYIVNGTLIKEDKGKEKFKIILILDMINVTYYVVPEIYINKQDILINEGKSLNVYTEKNIEDNNYNTFEYIPVDDQEVCMELVNNLRLNIRYDLDNVYSSLNEEYRKKKFPNESTLKEYIENNKLKDSELSKYKVNKGEYVCMDQFGNYILFKEKGIMDYSIVLDTYTINSDEFMNKYKNGNDQVKVGMNIEKIIQALNCKDYIYIYNKLDESFRNNKFNTIEKFKEYSIKEFFDRNKVEYLEFLNEGNIYIYKIQVHSTNEDLKDTRNVTVIMKLLEDTNFVMSFSLE